MPDRRPVAKACPVVLRTRNGVVEILAFEHPYLDKQLVKGGIEADESPIDAACRELTEESGLHATGAPLFLAATDDMPDGFQWHFYVCNVVPDPPDQWDFFTDDDGGLLFRFFWHPLDQPLEDTWHSLFQAVMEFLRPKLHRFLDGQRS